jgi:hypothetical protein
MKQWTIALFLSLWTGARIVDAGAIGQEPPATNPAQDEATGAPAAVEKPKEFKPPPGFVTKKRGKYVLYCKRDSTIGTRFKTEKCYDEAQMRDYLFAQQENKSDIDRVRSVCSNICICGQQC